MRRTTTLLLAVIVAASPSLAAARPGDRVAGPLVARSSHGSVPTIYGANRSIHRTAPDETAPSITTLVASSGHAGDTVQVKGSGLAVASLVMFSGIACSFSIVDDSRLDAVVPSGGVDGPFVVSSPRGTGTSPTFDLLEPTVSSLSASSGHTGDSVGITGTQFTADAIPRFGGVAATSFTVDSVTHITATVPAAARTGAVTVVTGSGTSNTDHSYSVLATLANPTVSPTSGRYNDSITFTGTGFSDVSAVKFNGTDALSFVVDSPTSLRALVPDATTGTVSVTTGGGSTTGTSFTVSTAPTILSLSANSGTPGASITITGIHLDTLTGVAQNGTSWTLGAYSYSSASVTVPEAQMIAAPVVATNPSGTGSSPANFTVTNFWVDFSSFCSADVLPPNVVQTIGGTMPPRILATGLHAVKWSSHDWSYDYRGTQMQFCGLWTAYDASENVASLRLDSTSHQFSSPNLGATVTDFYATGPDGTASASRVRRTSGSLGILNLNGGTITDATLGDSLHDSGFCAWVKDDPNDLAQVAGTCSFGAHVTSGGLTNWDCSTREEPTQHPDPTQWHWLCSTDDTHLATGGAEGVINGACVETSCYGGTSGDFHDYDHGCSIQNYNNCTTNIGSILVAFPMAWKGGPDDPPPHFGSDTTRLTAFPSVDTHVTDSTTLAAWKKSGIVDLEFLVIDSPRKKSNGFSKGTSDEQTVFHIVNSDGDWKLNLSQAGWWAKIRGVTTGFDASGGANVGHLGELWGRAPMLFRVYNDPTGNLAFTSATINGCTDITNVKSTTSPGANTSTPTGLYLGSDSGTTSRMPKLMVRFKANASGRDLHPEEFVFFGDSTTALQSNGEPYCNFVYRGTEALSRAGIVNYSNVTGHSTLSQAITDWNASAYKGKASLKAVVIMGWYNDLAAGTTAASLASSMNSWISSMKSSNAGLKVIVVVPIPCSVSSGSACTGVNTTQYNEWMSDVRGTGPNPITNVDAVVDFASVLDVNGDGVIDSNWSAAPPRPLSRTRGIVMGDYVRTALQNLGLLFRWSLSAWSPQPRPDLKTEIRRRFRIRY